MAENTTEEHQVPFCKPFICSLSSDNGSGEKKVLWDCVPSNCKSSIAIFLAVVMLLAVMTITFNCLILGINLATKTRRMRKRNPTMSNYSIYVVSLAIADLLVGVVVLPLCLVNFYLEFMVNELSPSPTQSNDTVVSTQASIGFSGDSPTTAAYPFGTQAATDNDATTIVRTILGGFTHLTLFVSIYTLITASADRLYAAKYSAQFSSSQFTTSSTDQTKTNWLRDKVRSMRRSTIAVLIVWVLGIIFAILPTVRREDFHFRQVGHIFAAMTSDNYGAVIKWYLATLVLPLIGIWLLNVAICFTLWRRKSQLGLLRKRSLRRNHSGTTSDDKPPPSPKLGSNSDSVFEPSTSGHVVVQKYPASRWNQSTSVDEPDIKPQMTNFHPMYRHKPTNSSETTVRSPGSTRSQTSQWESRGSVLRRKASSIRRAKEMLRMQSYEANITKTLCIVVVAFTIAVLPVIISLSTLTINEEASFEKLNKEVTVITLSLLLLFSNSFVNCVIYGARMRDFRTTLCQLFRTLADKIKNTFCCCCFNAGDNFSSEVVSGVFLVTKNHVSDGYPRSPHMGSTGGTFERFKLFSRSSSRKSLNREASAGRVLNNHTDDIERTASMRKTFYPMTAGNLVTKEPKNARPSSSGYRTDPERQSVQEENSKKRNSQRSEIGETIREDQPSEELANSSHTTSDSTKLQNMTEMTLDEKTERSELEENLEHDTGNSTDNIPLRASSENFEIGPLPSIEGNFSDNSRDSELRNSTDFTLDIDFSQFSTL